MKTVAPLLTKEYANKWVALSPDHTEVLESSSDLMDLKDKWGAVSTSTGRYGRMSRMKKVQKSRVTKDPTLGEFFDFVKEKFETNDGRLTLIEEKIDTRFKSTNDRFDGIDARLGDLQRGQTKMQNIIGDIQDDLASALRASDNDGSAILNHEHRISHLEKLGGVKSTPPKHLAGLE